MRFISSIGSGRLSIFLLSSWLCSVHRPVLPFVSFLRYFLLSLLAFRAHFPSNHTSGREIPKSSASSRVTVCSVSRSMSGVKWINHHWLFIGSLTISFLSLDMAVVRSYSMKRGGIIYCWRTPEGDHKGQYRSNKENLCGKA